MVAWFLPDLSPVAEPVHRPDPAALCPELRVTLSGVLLVPRWMPVWIRYLVHVGLDSDGLS